MVLNICRAAFFVQDGRGEGGRHRMMAMAVIHTPQRNLGKERKGTGAGDRGRGDGEQTLNVKTYARSISSTHTRET